MFSVHTASFRHPEPKLVDQQRVTDPTLQIRGLWRKLKPTGPSPLGRLAFASFVWRGRFYICGGQNWRETMKFPLDLWYLPLEPLGKWKRLPDHPEGNALLGVYMRRRGDKAYMFKGKKDHLWVFDLTNEKWYTQKTTYTSITPWPFRSRHDQYCVEIFEGVMYVFGGGDSEQDLGTNVFLALDLTTYEWTYLGGTPEPRAVKYMPDLRRHASSWVIPHQQRFYVMYGNVNRSGALMYGKPHGNTEDFQYGHPRTIACPRC
jgi:hypothetical protein